MNNLTHCKHGHPFDHKNTRVRANGTRQCRACDRIAQDARRRAAGIAPHPSRTPLAERIKAGISVQPNGCWTWTRGNNSHGYGTLTVNNRTRQVHRLSYELFVGPVAPGLELDHRCRNTMCANPEHLDPVPHRTNVLRGVGPSAVNATKTHCHQGHPYDDRNTYWRPRSGKRMCRTCERLRWKTGPWQAVDDA